MKRTILLLCMLLLLLAQTADAMSSANYRIDWNNLASGSGGPASSAGYQVNFTVGQTASLTSSSPLYRVQMGYWGGLLPGYTLFVPNIMR